MMVLKNTEFVWKSETKERLFIMDTWEIWINGYYRTCHLTLTKVSLFWNFILDLNFYICSKMPNVKLPHWKIKRDGEETTIREYYEDLGSLYHITVCDRIFQLCLKKQAEYLKKKNIKEIEIQLPYEFVKENFKCFLDSENDNELFFSEDEDKNILKETKKYIEADHYEYKKFMSIQMNIKNRIGGKLNG
jgi:hypothetical protein